VNQQHTNRLSSWARLVGLALLLGVGVLASLGLTSGTVHAATTLTVTNCSNDSQLQADVSTANSDNANDTITFACSGAIPLTSTLNITGSMTLDGSGQSVTLDGNNSVQVLSVDSGVSFTLNALTIAHGSGVVTDGGGGGIYNQGMLSISNSTVSGNSAGNGGDGGGILNAGGTLSISNSTVSGNSASRGGGGIYNQETLSISNSTVSGNSAPSGEGGGIEIHLSIVNNIGGSIVAANTGGDCSVSGFLIDQGYNLSSDSSCGFTASTSQQNTNPMLASGLANNGGPTQTLALLDGSPAINKIPASACTVTTDQRGISRPQGPACDIGAFEFRVPKLSLPSSPLTVDATSPQGATVTYTATASEPDDASATPTVSCTPASGSTFAIGTTTVNCTASDAASPPDTTTGSFQVVVNGAAAQVSDLMTTVNSMGLSSGLQNSLDVKLNAALKAVNAGQTSTACSDLSDFIGQAQSQSGKGLTVSQANQLIAAATQVQAVLGC